MQGRKSRRRPVSTDGSQRPLRSHLSPQQADRARRRNGDGRSLPGFRVSRPRWHRVGIVPSGCCDLSGSGSLPRVQSGQRKPCRADGDSGGFGLRSVLEKPQRDALAYLFVRLHEQGLIVASIFWGLWLFPLGMLVLRSGFIPRILGVLLMLAGIAYLASSSTSLVLPQYADTVGQVVMVLYFGELPFIVWLLIWGVRLRPSTAPAAGSAGG